MSAAGGHKLVHVVRMLIGEHREWVCVKLDIENAQNAVIKASLLETMDSEPSLQHLSLHAASVLAMPSALESGGLVWGEQGDGFTQGDAEISGNYAVATQPEPELRELDEELAMAGGCARAGNDNVYLLRPPEAVARAGAGRRAGHCEGPEREGPRPVIQAATWTSCARRASCFTPSSNSRWTTYKTAS